MHSSPILSASSAPTASLENQVNPRYDLTVFYWSTMIEPRKPIRFFQVNARKTDLIEGSTIVETPVSLTVNGEVWTTFMCTPVHLEALMVGFLFNEGVIDSMDEVEDVRICEHGDNVDVWLTHAAPKPDSWTRTSGCTGGVTAVASIERPKPVPHSGRCLFQMSSIWSPARSTNWSRCLFELQELYRETGGVHTSALSDGKRVILSAEDIGRHNTLDKIAGRCLMENILAREAHPDHHRADQLRNAPKSGAHGCKSHRLADLTLIALDRAGRSLGHHPDRLCQTQQV